MLTDGSEIAGGLWLNLAGEIGECGGDAGGVRGPDWDANCWFCYKMKRSLMNWTYHV